MAIHQNDALSEALRTAFGSGYQRQISASEREEILRTFKEESEDILNAWVEENIRPLVSNLNEILTPHYQRQEDSLFSILRNAFKGFNAPFKLDTHYKIKTDPINPSKIECQLIAAVHHRHPNNPYFFMNSTIIELKTTVNEKGNIVMNEVSGTDHYGDNLHGISRCHDTVLKPHTDTLKDLNERMIKLASLDLLAIDQYGADNAHRPKHEPR